MYSFSHAQGWQIDWKRVPECQIALGCPWLIRCPCAEQGEFCRFITADMAGPERIAQGRVENEQHTGGQPRFLLPVNIHTLIKRPFPLASPFVAFNFLTTPRLPSFIHSTILFRPVPSSYCQNCALLPKHGGQQNTHRASCCVFYPAPPKKSIYTSVDTAWPYN